MAEFWIDFESIILEASDSDEAFNKARQIVSAGEVEIDHIVEK